MERLSWYADVGIEPADSSGILNSTDQNLGVVSLQGDRNLVDSSATESHALFVVLDSAILQGSQGEPGKKLQVVLVEAAVHTHQQG